MQKKKKGRENENKISAKKEKKEEEYSVRGINNSIKLTCAIHWGATQKARPNASNLVSIPSWVSGSGLNLC